MEYEWEAVELKPAKKLNVDFPKEITVDNEITIKKFRKEDTNRLVQIAKRNKKDFDFNGIPLNIPDLKTATKYIDRENNRKGRLSFGIYFNDILVGGIDLHSFHTVGSGQLILAQPSLWLDRYYRGHGIAVKSLDKLINEAFKKLDIEYIEAWRYERNTSSHKLTKRLGFVEHEIDPEDLIKVGKEKIQLINSALHKYDYLKNKERDISLKS